MGQDALHLSVTALSEPRLSALDELWAEMGRYRNCSTTVGPPAWPIPWPLFKQEFKQEEPESPAEQ